LPPLAGSAILVLLALARLPPAESLLRAPETPFDQARSPSFAADWALLSRAAPLVPAGASVAARVEPPDPAVDTYLHRFAVALLPGRRVLPAALWGAPAPELEREADYLVVLGPRPTEPPGELLLQTPAGSVWRRKR
jgi:hypothetical protein